MIEVENVSYRYRSGTEALRDVSVTFPEGEISALLGESGSGKTTLLMCLGRFYEPTSGRILLEGKPVRAYEDLEFRRRVGIVFQKLYLFPHLTILENMVLACVHALGRDRAASEQDAREMLERLGIPELAESYPVQVSGGQAQRAAIARALILEPRYVLLDEPTSALDARTTDDFADWLIGLKETTNFVIVTHDVLFARRVATTGHLLADGRVRASGTVDDIVKDMRAGSGAGDGGR